MADPKPGKRILTSAMVDLKAELHRKQDGFRRQKVGQDHFVKGRKIEKIKTKKNIWSQQNRGVAERSSKDIEEIAEEEDELLKSRRMLDHKSKLYNEMSSTSNIPDEDGSEGFLVDFQKKAVDRIVEEREKDREAEEEKRELEAERKALAEPVPEPADSDEEWVDFTDSLGRSRRCMKRDLDRMKDKDRELVGDSNHKVPSGVEGDNCDNKERPGPELPDLMSSDMHREKMRQKWEEEAQTLLDKGQDDIHYSNVQFDEIRSHGVGFYQFSKDHEARKEQLDKLNKLRDQTVSEASHNERIKAKRKALMETRLAKVRDRRKLKEVATESKPEEENAKAEADLAAKRKEEEEERKRKAESEKEEAQVRMNHIREWDKEKQKNSWEGSGYMESRRGDREAEFAPPSIYYENDRGNKRTTPASDQVRISRLKQSTVTRGANPEFAPPSSYDNNNKGGGSSGSQRGKGNAFTHRSTVAPSNVTKIITWEEAMAKSKLDTEKFLNKGSNHSNAEASDLVDDVSVGSIPLPGEDCKVDGGSSSGKGVSLAGNLRGIDEMNETVALLGHESHLYSLQHQQQQQQGQWEMYRHPPQQGQQQTSYQEHQQYQQQQYQQQQYQQQQYQPQQYQPQQYQPQQQHQQYQHQQQQQQQHYQQQQQQQHQQQHYQQQNHQEQQYQQQHHHQQQQQQNHQEQQCQQQDHHHHQQQQQQQQQQNHQEQQCQQQDHHHQQQQQQQQQNHQEQQCQQQQQQQQQQNQQQQQSSQVGVTLASKRQITDESYDKVIPKKPKVPKNAIIDMRFLINEQATPNKKGLNLSADTSPTEPIIPTIEAVPYEPGSFTAARIAQGVKYDDNNIVDLSTVSSSSGIISSRSSKSSKKAQFSGGPKLYTKQQQEGQQKKLEDVGDGDEEADQKLQDFLTSIRNETS